MSRREAILKEMGLSPLWKLRQPLAPVDAPQRLDESAPGPGSGILVPAVADSPSSSPAVQISPPSSPLQSSVAGLEWEELLARIRDCKACGLCQGRKQVVPGVGDRQADWLFVGEGPGAEEDARGEPFVGQAGKLLDNMLAAIDLKRGHDVYIANAVKCRPPENRTPEPDETAACWPYLERQIALIQPRVIVALGRPAAQTLLRAEIKIGAARGQLHRYGDIPVIVTYHPAYLLRNLADKSKSWEDLVFARRTMAALKR